MSEPPVLSRNWSSWINTVLLLCVGALIKWGVEDFKRKQDSQSAAIETLRQEMSDKMTASEMRMQKMEDAQNIWLTTLPHVQEEIKDVSKNVEANSKSIQNHEWRLQSLENERRKP